MKKYMLFVYIYILSAVISYGQLERETNLPAGDITCLDIVDGQLYAGYDSLLFRTSDGLSWTAMNPISNSAEIIQTITSFEGQLFVGTFAHGVFKSTDSGVSWDQINTGLSGLGAQYISAFVTWQNKLIMGTYGAGTYVLNADMQSWSPFGNLPLNISGTVYSMTSIGDTLIAGAGANGYIYKLTPGSNQWEEINFSGGLLLSALSFAHHEENLYMGSHNGVWKSSNNGLKWDYAGNGLESTAGWELIVRSYQKTLYAMASVKNVTYIYRSDDAGQNWTLDIQPKPGFSSDMEVFGDRLFVANEDGLWYRDLSTTDVDKDKELPNDFLLSQNYPNPFNPSTVIEFHLPSEGFVTLKVFDVLGREVKTLLNEYRAQGRHTVTFDAKNLAGGVYFYQLKTKNRVLTKKMILVS